MKTIALTLLCFYQQFLLAQTKDPNEETKKMVLENLSEICNYTNGKYLTAIIKNPKHPNNCCQKIDSVKVVRKKDSIRVIHTHTFGFPNFSIEQKQYNTNYSYYFSISSSINEGVFKNIQQDGIKEIGGNTMKFIDKNNVAYADVTIANKINNNDNFTIIEVTLTQQIDMILHYESNCKGTHKADYIYSSDKLYYIIPVTRIEDFKKNLLFLQIYYEHKAKQEIKWVDKPVNETKQ